MKKIKLLLVVLVTLFISCSEDGTIADLLPRMTATVDGQEWKATARKTNLTDIGFIITGTAVSGETIIITVLSDQEGTYTLGNGNLEFTAAFKETLEATIDDTYAAVSGSVTLDEVDTDKKRISGIFELNMGSSTNTFTIEDGVFDNLLYTEQAE